MSGFFILLGFFVALVSVCLGLFFFNFLRSSWWFCLVGFRFFCLVQQAISLHLRTSASGKSPW